MSSVTSVAISCPSCHQTLASRYCANCGEKRIDEHDFSLKHQVEELLESFTHLDNKLFRTVKTLVAKPGMLSLNYVQGIRVPFMKPFQLFIVSNLLFFLLQGQGNIFALSLNTYYQMQPYKAMGTEESIKAKLGANTNFDLLATIFNNQIVSQSKALIFLFLPLLTLACALLFFRRRRFLAEHLIFATHFFSFIVLFYIAFGLLVNKPFLWITNQQYNEVFDILSSLAGLGLIMLYCGIAIRRFYKVGRGYAAFSSLAIGATFLIGIYGYRMLLFYKIIAGITI